MDMIAHIGLGIQAAFGGPSVLGIPLNVLMVAGGLFFGVLVGATPGLAGPMAMAVALPILISIFGFETSALLPVLGFMLGVMKGATVGGAVPAILFNTPGTPDALMTTLDGYPMTKSGQSKKALKVAHFSSVSGDTVSDIILFICAPFLAILVEAYLDLPEKSALILMSLTFIAAVVGKPVSKGVLAVALGLFISFIGTGEDFYPRLTGNVSELSGGFSIGVVVLGVLILGEIFTVMEKSNREMHSTGKLTQHNVVGDGRLTWAERVRLLPYIGRSAAIGTMIGALPGIGSTLAATIGYTTAKSRYNARKPKDAPHFGEGAAEGVASTEAANSAVSGANLIPVLSLGIPGNTAAIFLILAMETINGINPGPGVFKVPSSGVNPEMVMAFGLFTLMAFANLLNWVIGGRLMQLMSVMIKVPKQILMPAVLLVTITSVYAEETSLFSVAMLICFGALGYVMRKLGFPILPFVVAFILGRPLEATSRQAFASVGADPWFLFSSYTSIGLMAASVFILIYFSRKR